MCTGHAVVPRLEPMDSTLYGTFCKEAMKPSQARSDPFLLHITYTYMYQALSTRSTLSLLGYIHLKQSFCTRINIYIYIYIYMYVYIYIVTYLVIVHRLYHCRSLFRFTFRLAGSSNFRNSRTIGL